MNQPKQYTGLCAENAPKAERQFLCVVAEKLAREGYFLRSGGLEEYSSPFEAGVLAPIGIDPEAPRSISPPMHIYLPFGMAGERVADQETYIDIQRLHHMKTGQYHEVASAHRDVRLTISVNRSFELDSVVPALLGSDLNKKSLFMVCWASNPTFDNKNMINDCSGSMSMAVRIAYSHGIEIFNTAVPTHKHRLLKWITGDNR
ncbi:hypothetical protein ACRN9F_22140 [Shewanella oncorhynchi]|uniref:hypothetical protein n=1 Tax=Shewanella oncorhynchi TaxID=2726434 RepID=UPI003D78FC3E